MGAREVPVAPPLLPASLVPLVADGSWSRDLGGESGGYVHRLQVEGRPDRYLKHGAAEIADAVTTEMVRMRWLTRHLAVPSVEAFVLAGDEAWLLMTAVSGRTAFQTMADDPEATVDALAAHLRALHAIPIDLCPFDSGHLVRLAAARARIDRGVVEVEDFDEDHAGWTAEQVWDELTALLPLSPDAVVTHGDYSLDNILLVDGRVGGCIDLDRVGVADRWQDLAILWNCLGELGARWQDRLLDRYGIAADPAKLRFHRCLDELF